MNKLFLILAATLATISFTGCGQDNLTISKCLEYNNGACVSKEQIPVTKCKEPIKVGKETYCRK